MTSLIVRPSVARAVALSLGWSLIVLTSESALKLGAAEAGAASKPAPGGGAHHAPGGGIKHELIAGITEADFLKLGEKPKTAKLTVVAVFTDANYGMNFNGHAHGKAGYTVPTGWTVEVTFINPSPVPHSAIVVERDMVRKLQMGEPVFAGAATPKPAQGTSAGKETFTFVASEAGDFALACGFPTHAINGHWIAFNVRDDTKAPTFTKAEGATKAAK